MKKFKEHLLRNHPMRLHLIVIFSSMTIFGYFLGKVLLHSGLTGLTARNALVIPASYLFLFIAVRIWLSYFLTDSLVKNLPAEEPENKTPHEPALHRATSKWDWLGYFPADVFGELGLAILAFLVFFLIAFLVVSFFVEGPVILTEAVYEMALSATLAKAALRGNRDTWYEGLLKKTALVFVIFWIFSICSLAVIENHCPGRARLTDVFHQCLIKQ